MRDSQITAPLKVLSIGTFLLIIHLTSHHVYAGYTVNSTLDEPDANIGDEICETLSGVCTLRAAVQEANAKPGSEAIGLEPGETYILTLTGDEENASANGDIDITDDVIISANYPWGAVVDGNGTSRVFHVHGVDVTFNGLTIQNGIDSKLPSDIVVRGAGLHGESGSDIYLLTSKVQNNNGTGIHVIGNLEIRGSVISNNTQGAVAGGIEARSLSSSSFFKLYDSAVINNSSSINGGIYTNNIDVTIENSTISGNNGGASTGGILFSSVHDVNISYTTIADNTGDFVGGIYSGFQQTNLPDSTILTNTLLAGNTGGSGGNCYPDLPLPSAGYNLSTDDSCGFSATGDQNSVDPLIGPLALNGDADVFYGFTHALNAGSPAIDTADPSNCTILFDQRHVSRPQGTACDIGAYEFEQTVDPCWLIGDINADGIVDLRDYSLLIINFFSTTPDPERADIDIDGIVDLRDYSILIANFWTECP